MVEEPTGQWHEPSLASSYEEGSSSSDKSTSYKEEVLTLRPQKKSRTEEEVLTYTQEKTGPSTRASRTLGQDNADDEGHVSI
jgi:hypothetical protein